MELPSAAAGSHPVDVPRDQFVVLRRVVPEADPHKTFQHPRLWLPFFFRVILESWFCIIAYFDYQVEDTFQVQNKGNHNGMLSNQGRGCDG